MSPEDSARLSAIAKDVSGAETELAKLKKNAAGLVEQAEKLQGQIDNAGGAKMKKQKQTVSDLQQVHYREDSIDISRKVPPWYLVDQVPGPGTWSRNWTRYWSRMT